MQLAFQQFAFKQFSSKSFDIIKAVNLTHHVGVHQICIAYFFERKRKEFHMSIVVSLQLL